ncbi:MAG TPA: ABC transporter substrate-binding protein [Acidimicrobiia bacterium]|nr:ABC transporter substrate-binding protein [Acidimicrobiia bacterium]
MRSGHPSRLRVLAVLVCLALVAAACTAGEADESTTTTSDSGTDATDAPTTTSGEGGGDGGGEEATRLIFGVPPPPDGESNNPNRDIQPNDEYQLKPMYENLVAVDPETAQWVPMLAESWELSDAGDQLTFNLRQGVQFHNDFGEMTAADVVFSMNDLIDPPGAISGVAEAVRNAVDEFEIVDDYTVIFHIAEGGLSYSFFEGISYGAAGTVIKSQADWEARGSGSPASPTLDEAPIAGTGPYQFLERTPGQNVIFEKIPYAHWRQDASFQELEYRFIPEDATRLSALLAGEIHLTGLPTELGDEAESQGMAVVQSTLPGRRYGLPLEGCYYVEPPLPGEPSAEVFVSGDRKFPDSPWCNVDIRRAVSKAIDRDALNEAFFGGEAESAIMWYWLPEQTESWNPEWESRYADEIGYDPEGAAALLESVGEPVEIQVFARNDIVEAIAVMLEEVGFVVDLISMDDGQFTAQREAREFDRMLDFDDTASENITGFEPAGYANQDSGRAIEMVEWDTQYEQVLTELDPDAQQQLWGEFGNVIFDNIPHIPLLRTYDEIVVNPEVVCGYTFPGANMSAPYSFVEYISSC